MGSTTEMAVKDFGMYLDSYAYPNEGESYVEIYKDGGEMVVIGGHRYEPHPVSIRIPVAEFAKILGLEVKGGL